MYGGCPAPGRQEGTSEGQSVSRRLGTRPQSDPEVTSYVLSSALGMEGDREEERNFEGKPQDLC